MDRAEGKGGGRGGGVTLVRTSLLFHPSGVFSAILFTRIEKEEEREKMNLVLAPLSSFAPKDIHQS